MLPRSSLRRSSVFPALKRLLIERNQAIDLRMRKFEDSLQELNTKHAARISMSANRLLPEQETRVDLILKEFTELNQFEKRAFFAVFEEKRKKGFDTAKGEGNYTGNEMDTGSVWPYNHPRNIEFQLETGTKGQLGLHGFTSAFSAKLASGEAFQSLESVEISASAAGPSAEASQAKVEEAPKEEKTSFNLMLKGFASEAKLKVIKEVKNVLNLGLKEAKEKVEGAAKEPVLLFKNVAKESVKAAVEKLTAAGADLEWK